MPASWNEIYRGPEHEGERRLSEEDAVAELMVRSAALRNRFTRMALAAGLCAGAALTAAYVATAKRIYGQAAGLVFAVGALVAFTIVRVVTSRIARGVEAVWAARLAERHGLSAEALRAPLQMLR